MPSFLAEAGWDAALFGDRTLHRRIVEAVSRTESQEQRERRLPAVLMMYLVLGLSLYRRLAIPEVLKELLNGLRWAFATVPLLRRPPTESSLSEARYRLGEAPFKELFKDSVALIDSPVTFYGKRVHAIDGVRFVVPDTKRNVAEFGRPKSGRGHAAYPIALVVTMVDVYSHRIESVSIQPHNGGERTFVLDLIRGLDESDVVLMDRGFPSAQLLWQFSQAAVHFVVRIPSTWKPRVVRRLATGDYIVELPVKVPCQPKAKLKLKPRSKKGRKPSYKTAFLSLRMVVYRCDGKRDIRLLTSLVDPSVKALDLAKLYHERWEAELTLDEMKNHFAVGFHGSPDLCVRSKDPVGVRQELYAMFTMFNHTRDIIAISAASYGLVPLQISFVKALNAIRRCLPLLVSSLPDEIDRLTSQLYREIALHCQGRERRPRHYQRKVKIKMSDFKCKKPSDGQTIVDFSAQTTMVDPAPCLGPAR